MLVSMGGSIKSGFPFSALPTQLALLRGMRLFPHPCLSLRALWMLGRASFSWEGKVMGSAPVVLAPSFISSLSWVAFHLATDPAKGVGGLQLEASRRRARWGPGGQASRALRLPTTPTLTASVQRLPGLRRALRAFELRAAGGNEKPP